MLTKEQDVLLTNLIIPLEPHCIVSWCASTCCNIDGATADGDGMFVKAVFIDRDLGMWHRGAIFLKLQPDQAWDKLVTGIRNKLRSLDWYLDQHGPNAANWNTSQTVHVVRDDNRWWE